jgi:hypothetical protein
MMTTFPGSPRVLKGALVAINLPDPTLNVIVFQYNPVTLTRSLQGQLAGEGEQAAGPVRLSGAPEETIDLGEVEIDAADQLEKGSAKAARQGILPQLAALETLLYPRSERIISNFERLAVGALEIIPPVAPFTILIYGPNRILPVQLSSLSITEEAFDVNLNPIRATVSLSLRVLSYNDLLPEHPGHALFLAHQVAKEAMATQGMIHSLDGVAGGDINLL